METARSQTLLTSFHSGFIQLLFHHHRHSLFPSSSCSDQRIMLQCQHFFLSLETSVRFTIGASEEARWFDTKRQT